MPKTSPSLSTSAVLEQLRDLESLDRKVFEVDELGRRFRQIFGGFSCFTHIIDTQYAYRARKHDERIPFPNALHDLWYPQPNKVVRHGRVNRIGQPMFYIAASEATAILEMRPKVGDLITILLLNRKNLDRKLHVMELGVCEMNSIRSRPDGPRLLENTPLGRRYFRSKDAIRRNLAIRSFLAREFTRVVERNDEHLFKMTIAIAGFLLSSDRIDGIEYPSLAGDVAQWNGGANLALKPASADALFAPLECWVIEVAEQRPSPERGFGVRCLLKADRIDSDGTIHWPSKGLLAKSA